MVRQRLDLAVEFGGNAVHLVMADATLSADQWLSLLCKV